MKLKFAAIAIALLSMAACNSGSPASSPLATPTAQPESSESINQRAMEELQHGDLAQAKNLFQEIVTKFPGSKSAEDAKTQVAQIDARLEAEAEVRRKASYQKIITKDPEYIAALNEPSGEDLLKNWSSSYNNAIQQVEAKVSGIADSDLKTQQRERLSRELVFPKMDQFRKEAELNFIAARQNVLDKHRNDWFEIGHVDYNGYSLIISGVGASPLRIASEYGGDGLHFKMDLPTMDSIYVKFDAVSKDGVEARKAQYRARTEEAYRMLLELNRRGIGVSAPEPLEELYAKADKAALKDERSMRLIMVGQGDLVKHKIDSMMLVDYITETVIANITSPIESGTISWRF